MTTDKPAQTPAQTQTPAQAAAPAAAKAPAPARKALSSAEKQAKLSKTRQLRNKDIHSLTKSTIAQAEELITSGKSAEARRAVAVAVSTLDKAAEKGIIHPNSAARRKSRLLHKLSAAPKPAVRRRPRTVKKQSTSEKPSAVETKPADAK